MSVALAFPVRVATAAVTMPRRAVPPAISTPASVVESAVAVVLLLLKKVLSLSLGRSPCLQGIFP